MAALMSERCTPELFPLLHPLRVRWAEVDAQGLVFNPHYFGYADIAMTEYLRAAGVPYPSGLSEFGSDLFAIRAEADYLRSARYDDLLSLGARVEYIGRTSVRFLTGVFRKEELLTELRVTYVNASTKEQKPMPLPAMLVNQIVSFERMPPQRKT